MKHILPVVLSLLFPLWMDAQSNYPDSLIAVMKQASNDSVRFKTSRELLIFYREVNRDSAFHYAAVALRLAQQNKKKLAEAQTLVSEGYLLLITGKYAVSLQNLLRAFTIIQNAEIEKNNWVDADSVSYETARLGVLGYAHHTFANLMTPTLNREQQIFHYKEAMRIGKETNNLSRVLLANLGLGRTYFDMNNLDSSLHYETEAERVSLQSGYTYYLSVNLSYIGAIYLEKGRNETGLQYLYTGIQSGKKENNKGGLAQVYYQLVKYYLSENKKDSALYYAKEFNQLIQSLEAVALSTLNRGTGYENLFLAYKLNNQFDSAYKYQGLALVTKDSLLNFRIKNLAEFQNLSFQEQLRLQNIAREKELYQNKIRIYGLLGGLAVFLLIAFILFRNNRQKQKTNKVLETTLSNLKSTQTQLIQSEKMASLGELTAGIAHEIQNPLNFVNNFSDVNSELIDEMQVEMGKGNYEEAAVISKSIKENEEKIKHHGRRADAIVKGMLQHSRTSSGQKELTDINALCNEYLRLSYHGLRAKDKSFNAEFKTDFDTSIGKINIVPQDIGRVILNLLTNAFYAVSAEALAKGNSNYVPTVTVSTKKLSDKVEIRVKDNGGGMPQKLVDKIFQPFFTTKPTGQGTGLGLSLAYDVIKAHGGEIIVETKEGEGSEFVVQLPIV
jgi:two-component system NtrC family sensor kinase